MNLPRVQFTRTIVNSLLGLLILFSVDLIADEIIIPITMQSEQSISKPEKSQSMAQVEKLFGQPLRKIQSTGVPAIDRWRYPDFTVYFENEKVIHAVLHHKRPKI